MWRWILGIVAFVILALVGTCYAGYRRITGGGNTVVTLVAGNVPHAFTLLTDRDSLLTWMAEGTTITPAGHGALRAGDTIRVAGPARGAASGARTLQVWIVRDVKAPDVVAVEALQFDQGGVAHTAYTRRDSLSAAADSTQIVSTFVLAPLAANIDSVTASRPVTGALITTAEKMRLGAARMLWQGQLRGIGHHVSP
jgi:hypothetical protein